jgi:adenylyltransferase/sulfurtransferase
VRTVVLIGAGGLGCPLALELALAGDRVVLCDFDNVELSNLPRQVLYRSEDVGRPKVVAAADALLRRGVPAARVETVQERFAPALLAGADAVCEGSDDLHTKFAVNDAAVAAGLPVVVGGVLRHAGQVFSAPPGAACYRCLFEEPPDDAPSCADAGVLGPLCLLVATTMAQAVRAPRAGLTLLPEDRHLTVRRRPGCTACGGVAAEVHA